MGEKVKSGEKDIIGMAIFIFLWLTLPNLLSKWLAPPIAYASGAVVALLCSYLVTGRRISYKRLIIGFIVVAVANALFAIILSE